jgi:hypothetical protein
MSTEVQNPPQKVSLRSQYTLFKAKKTGDGAASSWVMSDTKDGERQLFLEMARQNGEMNANGNATFDWKKYDKATQSFAGGSISAKLGLPDVGEILLVLNGVKKAAGFDGKGLFHKNANGSTTINFATWEKDNALLGFTVRVASKRSDNNNEVVSVSHAISLAEAEVLRTLLNHSVLQMCNW